jgi:hypothetical protein
MNPTQTPHAIDAPATRVSDAPATRVSDAERARAVELLAHHHGAGRLDLVEFDERAAAVWNARTRADLRTQFTDLPDDPLPGTGRTRRPRRPRTDPGTAVHVGVYLAVVVGLWVLWAVTNPGHPWPVYPTLGWGAGVVAHALVARHCGGTPTGGPGGRTPARRCA